MKYEILDKVYDADKSRFTLEELAYYYSRIMDEGIYEWSYLCENYPKAIYAMEDAGIFKPQIVFDMEKAERFEIELSEALGKPFDEV